MRRAGAVWKLDSVSLASTNRLPSCRSISVRSVKASRLAVVEGGIGGSRTHVSALRPDAPGLSPVSACEFSLRAEMGLVARFRVARRLRMVLRGTPGVMPKQGFAVASTLRRLATAGVRVWPLKTPGWQKMFMRRASELLEESSSIHCQSLRTRERREAVWTLARRRSHAGLAQMQVSDAGWKLP